METAKLRLVQERMIRQVIQSGLDESIFQSDFVRLGTWEKTLLKLATDCEKINDDPRLSPMGKQAAIANAIEIVERQLSVEETTISSIMDGIKSLDGSITNEIFKALGKNRVLDPTAALLEEMQKREIRTLLCRKQEQEEKAHVQRLEQAKRDNIPLSDQERACPNITRDAYVTACKNFSADTKKNRLLVTAIQDSPVQLIDDETVSRGEALLQQSVCPDLIQKRQAALTRVDGLHLMLNGLRDAIANPLMLNGSKVDPVLDSIKTKMAA